MKLTDASRDSGAGLSTGQIALIIFGLIAPVLTFILAVSSLPEAAKLLLLALLAFGYSFICFWAFKKSQTIAARAGDDARVAKEAELEDALQAIGEANEFFGTSLKPSDLFRLVSSRVGHVFPFATSALFVQTESCDALEIVQADGQNSDVLLGAVQPFDGGLAGMAWLSHEVEIDGDLKLESQAMSSGLDGLRSAVAVPLMHEGQPFAVLVLYRDQTIVADPGLNEMLQAIGERVAPLFISSISFERSVSNALTDSLTSLPNERAFFLVLENQLAESQRFRSERPLTVMSVDIKNFAEVNQNFGFAAGDKMLSFAAENLASQLRKMDFLSRSVNDEFLIILPTASEKFSDEIVKRIKDHFASKVFALSETEEVKVWLNIGWATFWQDGETADQLLQNARVRKQQAKAEEPSKVLWFPKEYVN